MLKLVVRFRSFPEPKDSRRSLPIRFIKSQLALDGDISPEPIAVVH
jgi:hypothetical protein